MFISILLIIITAVVLYVGFIGLMSLLSVEIDESVEDSRWMNITIEDNNYLPFINM